MEKKSFVYDRHLHLTFRTCGIKGFSFCFDLCISFIGQLEKSELLSQSRKHLPLVAAGKLDFKCVYLH